MTTTRRFGLAASTALALAIMGTIAAAQPAGPGMQGPDMMGPGNGPGAGQGRSYGIGPGMMMGPGMMGGREFRRMCSPRAAGFSEWRIDRIERAIKPTEGQRAKFDEFKSASNKAAEIMQGACLDEVPLTAVGRMAAMEKRIDAMSQAIKTVRPALDAFYASLSDEQKARFDQSLGRGGRHRHWRDRR